VWGENTALFRHEIRYEHSYDAPAYDLGTRKNPADARRRPDLFIDLLAR
jgi:hypothetical protein